jgi:outer membrane protein OmpA-like peptidoglycan-associated protein
MKRLLSLTLLAVALVSAPAAAADLVGRDDIVKALTPKPRTRAIVLEANAPPPPPPSIDLNVEFEYDSATLTATARQQLDYLGEALRSDGLRASRFEIAGHTDARGTAAYNQSLSERRAQSVRDYLTGRHGIGAAQLAAAGWGFTRLKNTADPYAAENRRVQISNLGQ